MRRALGDQWSTAREVLVPLQLTAVFAIIPIVLYAALLSRGSGVSVSA